MDLDLSPDDEAFRAEVRAFVEGAWPPAGRVRALAGARPSRDDLVTWQRTLWRRGWGAPSWPVEHGGAGWTGLRQHLFDEACALAGAPPQVDFGLRMVGPVIMTFGTEEQRQRFLPRIIAGEDWWCQGYSEPGSGSDLASLKTRAERRGDHYAVTGQKIWVTLAHHADWIFCLVRTDPHAKSQAGISFLLVDMRSPGVSVRPIITMDGGHEINEVWFEDVSVPRENLIGEENRGWTYAKFLLGHERNTVARVAASKGQLARLKRIAALETKNHRPLAEDPMFAARLAQVEMELMALEITHLRMLSADARQALGPEVSLLKIKGSVVQQMLAELMAQAVGPYARVDQREVFEHGAPDQVVGPPYAPPLGPAYFNLRKTSIYSGSNEIQRNLVARHMLGAEP